MCADRTSSFQLVLGAIQIRNPLGGTAPGPAPLLDGIHGGIPPQRVEQPAISPKQPSTNGGPPIPAPGLKAEPVSRINIEGKSAMLIFWSEPPLSLVAC